MLRLFRMNLYRIFRSKSAWILLFAAIGIVILGTGINKIADVYFDKRANNTVETMGTSENTAETALAEEAALAEEDSFTVGIEYDAASKAANNTTIMGLLAGDVKGGMVLIFVIIFAALFISAEEKNGYVKNVSTLVRNKGEMVIPRICALAVYIIVFFLAYSLAEFAVYEICYPGTPIGFELSQIGFFGIEFLLSMCLITLTVMITTLTRSSGLGLTVGILLASGFHLVFAQLGNLLITAIAGKQIIDLNDYLTISWLTNLDPSSTGKWLWAAGLGLIYLVIWNIVNMFIVQKRDVA